MDGAWWLAWMELHGSGLCIVSWYLTNQDPPGYSSGHSVVSHVSVTWLFPWLFVVRSWLWTWTSISSSHRKLRVWNIYLSLHRMVYMGYSVYYKSINFAPIPDTINLYIHALVLCFVSECLHSSLSGTMLYFETASEAQKQSSVYSRLKTLLRNSNSSFVITTGIPQNQLFY